MANNSISDYLKRIGVKVPYEDMTKAQIDERDKANPLSGYGFQTAQEKRQLFAQQQAYVQAQQMQQQQQQTALMAQMPAQRAIGYGAGGALIQGLGSIFGHKQGQQGSPQPPQDDPEISRFNDLAKEVGPTQAKVMFGQELMQSGNPAGAKMMQDGQEELVKQQKMSAETENAQLDTQLKKKTLDKPAPNNVIQVQTMMDGKPALKSMEILGKDAKGKNIYRDLGQAVKGTVTDTNAGWNPTKSEAGKQLLDFEGEMTNTENTLDVADRITDLAKNAKSGPGFAEQLASKSSNFLYGFKGIMDIVGSNLKPTAKAKLSSSDPTQQYKATFNSLGGEAKNNAKLQSLLLEQAYLNATANGQKASDKDVEDQIKILGGNLNDPQAFAEVLQQNRELHIDRLMNKSNNSGGPDGTTLAETYKDRLSKIASRRNPQQASNTPGTVRMYKNGVPYDIPQDKADAAMSKGYTRG